MINKKEKKGRHFLPELEPPTLILVIFLVWVIIRTLDFTGLAETASGKVVVWLAPAIAIIICAKTIMDVFTKNGGGVRVPRIIKTTVFIVFLALAFWLPGKLFESDKVMSYYLLTPPVISENSAIELKEMMASHEDFKRILINHQRYLAMCFVVLIAIAYKWVSWFRNRNRKVKIGMFEFTENIGLTKGVTGGDKNHRGNYIEAAQDIISNKITSNMKLQILLINGKTDLVEETSEIRKSIIRNKPALRVLLLDPFSEYARRRAENLVAKDDLKDGEKAIDCYVRCYAETVSALDYLRDHYGVDVEYKTYCSRPLFRFYRGQNNNTTSWCATQFYLINSHGYESPLYLYEDDNGVNSRNNFSTLAKDAFEFIWGNGFSYECLDEIDIPLIYYLAKMNGVALTDGNNRVRDYADVLADLKLETVSNLNL